MGPLRIPGVPGPREVFGLVDDLLGLVPRITRLLDAAEGIIEDASGLVRRIDDTRVTADEVVGRIGAAATSADELLTHFAATQRRLVEMLDGLEPPLRILQPTLERLAETTDPREVDALVSLVDRLPLLAEQVERDVVPVMRTLSSVAPDLHELLDVSRELNDMLAKVPGINRMRGRS